MKGFKSLKRMVQPTGRILSAPARTMETEDTPTDLTMSERPLHDYVAEVSEGTDIRVSAPAGGLEYADCVGGCDRARGGWRS